MLFHNKHLCLKPKEKRKKTNSYRLIILIALTRFPWNFPINLISEVQQFHFFPYKASSLLDSCHLQKLANSVLVVKTFNLRAMFMLFLQLWSQSWKNELSQKLHSRIFLNSNFVSYQLKGMVKQPAKCIMIMTKKDGANQPDNR